MNDKSFTCTLWRLSGPEHLVYVSFSGYMGWWPDILAWLLLKVQRAMPLRFYINNLLILLQDLIKGDHVFCIFFPSLAISKLFL